MSDSKLRLSFFIIIFHLKIVLKIQDVKKIAIFCSKLILSLIIDNFSLKFEVLLFVYKHTEKTFYTYNVISFHACSHGSPTQRQSIYFYYT